MDLNYVILAIGILLLIWSVVFAGKGQAITDTPTSEVRSVAMGFAKLQGEARPRVMVNSPYFNLPCIYYRYLVEAESGTGRYHQRRTVKEGESSASFYLDDGTGKILVAPRGAEFRLKDSSRSNEGPEIITEWCITPGTRLYVAGTVGKAGDFSSVELNQGAHCRQELARLNGMLADVDLKPGEWSGPAARETARARIQKDIQDMQAKLDALNKAAAGAQTEELVVGKGGPESFFLISDMSEGELAQQSAYSSFLGKAVSVALIIYALWALTTGPF